MSAMPSVRLPNAVRMTRGVIGSHWLPTSVIAPHARLNIVSLLPSNQVFITIPPRWGRLGAMLI